MTTTDTTDPWCDENDTPIAVGDARAMAERILPGVEIRDEEADRG